MHVFERSMTGERKHLFDPGLSGILSDMDKNAFERAKLKVLLKQNDPHGFGTLQEKTVHAVMKLYYEPDEDCHEVPVEGYIADIYHRDTEREFWETASEAFCLPAALRSYSGSADPAF